MATRDSFEDDLSCPVCRDVFINPVVLSCSHSICEDCVRRFWESKTLRECPVCRRSSNDHPPVNLALKNLCETYRKRLSRKSSSTGGNICSVHDEKLKVFCLDDQEPVCLVCRDSRKHRKHRFCPVEEAALDKKKILKDALQRLEGHWSKFEFSKWLLGYDVDLNKSNAEDAESQIRKEFEELHEFLRGEEAARVTALREEEEQKNQKMKQKLEEMSRQISFLSSTIIDAEEQMTTDDVSFLQNFKATLESTRYVPWPAIYPSPTAITHFSNHLINLKLKVLQKMQENIRQNSFFNISPSDKQSDLAAMDITDHPDTYEHFQRDGSNLFGGLQQFKPKAPAVGATNVFPTVFSTEPTNNLPMIHRRLPLSQITWRRLTTSMNASVVEQPLGESVSRLQSPFRLCLRRPSLEDSPFKWTSRWGDP